MMFKQATCVLSMAKMLASKAAILWLRNRLAFAGPCVLLDRLIQEYLGFLGAFGSHSIFLGSAREHPAIYLLRHIRRRARKALVL